MFPEGEAENQQHEQQSAKTGEEEGRGGEGNEPISLMAFVGIVSVILV
jgi:hypothetical protein